MIPVGRYPPDHKLTQDEIVKLVRRGYRLMTATVIVAYLFGVVTTFVTVAFIGR